MTFKVGFIGLGIMGSRKAANLHATPWPSAPPTTKASRFAAGLMAREPIRHRQRYPPGLGVSRLIALAVSALAVTGCASMTVSSYVERSIDFGQYRTYDWGPADALPTGDPRLDQNPFFKDHVLGAVEKQLAAKGFERAASGTPDLLIHYHANISERIDVNRVDREYGYCYDDCQPRVTEYEEGTLVLDIVDTRTNKVIWRGWAQDSVKDVLDDPDKMERQINEGVTRMLERFPRGF